MATSTPFQSVVAERFVPMRLAPPVELRIAGDLKVTPETVSLHASDAAWLQELVAGQEAALTRLYKEHHAAVRALARRLLSRGNANDVEDIVHDVFVAAPTAFKNYRGEGSVRSFVFSIAVHQVRHYIRATSRRRAWLDRFAFARAVPAAPPTPEAQRAQRELADRLNRALETLSFEHRTAVVLCEVEEMTAGEAAQIVGVPEATVRTRLHHAKKKLRALLEGDSL
jgi:RNA polymerase sigma-70 factor (ECF subfamily)